MGQIKNYFQTINFKSLLQLSIIFKKKKGKINNNFETILLKNNSKTNFKKISIPYYILFKANQAINLF
jgi:hypothetical protein